ncbi:MAG: rod shape-determining protein MreC [Tissierellia bacterium]|nr:rod shape-determining protein MreC [Tissierellia bacterium]
MNQENKKKKIISASITIVILIILMILTSRPNKVIPMAEDILGSVFNPLNKAVSYTSSKGRDAFVYVFGTRKMRTENKELKEENENLKKEIAIYQSLIAKAEFLEDEYNLLKKTEFNLTPAYIISKDPNNFFINFTIDKGKKDGVKAGDIIVTGQKYTDSNYIESVVGKVESVGNNWAKVSSIIDENTSISFKNARTLELGVIDGKGEKGLSGYVFDSESDIKVGDKLLTSGLGGVFPRDLYIGEVIDVKMTEELVVQILVESKVDFSNLYRVLVLDRNEGQYEQD